MTADAARIADAARTASPAAILSTPLAPLAPVAHPVPALRPIAGLDAPAPAASPAPREPGIYFGLPEAAYHADPSLGSTDMKRLLRSPTDYWWGSWMNPRRQPEDYDTPAKKQGRALHKLVLEGRAAFHKAYIPEPQPAEWPDALRTMDDLRGVLREKGEKLAGTKEELAKRVKAVCPEAILWDDVVANFMAAVERDALQVLKPEAFAEVEVAGHMIGMNPHLANAFRGGTSEVSVFWRDEHGIPCKCRYDYLKPRTIPDLKKCANKGEHPFEDACRLAFMGYRYDIQVEHYLGEGYGALLSLADEGRIFGDCPLPAGFAERMAPQQAMTFTIVFHQTSGAPVTAGFEIPWGSPLLAQARADIAAAKARYLDCRQRFGTDMWVTEAPIREFAIEDLPYRYRLAAGLEAEMAEAA